VEGGAKCNVILGIPGIPDVLLGLSQSSRLTALFRLVGAGGQPEKVEFWAAP